MEIIKPMQKLNLFTNKLPLLVGGGGGGELGGLTDTTPVEEGGRVPRERDGNARCLAYRCKITDFGLT